MKEKKGITLIALIITIIVMLILAGVTIAIIIDGGLFDQAKEAKEKTMIEAGREIISVTLGEMQGDYLTKGKGKLTLENVRDEIADYLPEIEEVGEIENDGEKNILEVIYDGYIYVIDENLKIIDAMSATGLRVKLPRNIVLSGDEETATIIIEPTLVGDNPEGITVSKIQMEGKTLVNGTTASYEVDENKKYKITITLSNEEIYEKYITVTEIVASSKTYLIKNGVVTSIAGDLIQSPERWTEPYHSQLPRRLY